MFFVTASFFGGLAAHVVPCIIVGLIEYILTIKESKYVRLPIILSLVYGILRALSMLAFIYATISAIDQSNAGISLLSSIPIILTLFTPYITALVVHKIFKNKV